MTEHLGDKKTKNRDGTKKGTIMPSLPYLNLPGTIVVAIAAIFLITQLVGAIIGLKNGVAPEILSVKNHIINHRKRKKTLDEMPQLIADMNKGMKDLKDGLNGLKTDLQTLRDECEEREIIQSRIRILRFDDELRQGLEHTKEHYDQILIEIDKYERYCEEHEGFRNGIATHAISRINKAIEDGFFS